MPPAAAAVPPAQAPAEAAVSNEAPAAAPQSPPPAPPEPEQTAVAPAAAAPEKSAPAARGKNVYVVRFDSKLPGLTPTGVRALNAALRALDEGREVQIAIEGCETRDSVPEGADCAARVRRLKRMLTERGVDYPDELIAKPR
jgi:hypothetical protein